MILEQFIENYNVFGICLRDSAPAYLAGYWTSTSLVPGRSALRSAAHGDIVVPSHRTDWGLRSFELTGPSSLILTLPG